MKIPQVRGPILLNNSGRKGPYLLKTDTALGKRLYALPLTPDQAGVAWSHYHLCRTALEQAVTLRQPARVLLARVEQASPRVLPQLGTRLYRLQQAGAAPVSTTEWRRIWSAYHARRDTARA